MPKKSGKKKILLKNKKELYKSTTLIMFVRIILIFLEIFKYPKLPKKQKFLNFPKDNREIYILVIFQIHYIYVDIKNLLILNQEKIKQYNSLKKLLIGNFLLMNIFYFFFVFCFGFLIFDFSGSFFFFVIFFFLVSVFDWFVFFYRFWKLEIILQNFREIYFEGYSSFEKEEEIFLINDQLYYLLNFYYLIYF